ncbi:MAG: hypothetical protein ABIM62_01280 [candidate division WOR-3 bacterium]
MKIFLISILSLVLGILIYFKNFNSLLFLLRFLWLFLFLNLILSPVFYLNLKQKRENLVIFDKRPSMNYGNKIEEGEKFLKNIKGDYKIFFLKDEDELLQKIKTENIYEILLISDGNFSESFKKFIEEIGVPVNVYNFPQIGIPEEINVQFPSYVFEKEEFLIEIFLNSKKNSKGRIEINGEGINIKKEIDIKEGENKFNFKISFKNEGRKKISMSILKNGERIKKEFEVNVLKKGVDVVIICEKPMPILKILREFIKKRITENINIFVRVSPDRIVKINEKIEKGEIPPQTDFLIVLSPNLMKDYKKILNSKRIFYFYEGIESQEIKGKNILKGENFGIEIHVPLKIFPKKIYGNKILLIESDSKEFEAAIQSDKETHVLIANFFEILFPYEEKLRDTILNQIFKTGELKNPEISYFEIKGSLKEDEEFLIKCFLFTPLLKPSFDSDVRIRINDKNYPMVYEGKGAYASPPLRMKKGKYDFDINIKRDNFEKKIYGNFEIFEREIIQGIDRECLLSIARKTGGNEIKNGFEFKEKKYFEKKYEFDLRKNMLSYIFITLIFLIEIFFRKKEGYL